MEIHKEAIEIAPRVSLKFAFKTLYAALMFESVGIEAATCGLRLDSPELFILGSVTETQGGVHTVIVEARGAKQIRECLQKYVLVEDETRNLLVWICEYASDEKTLHSDFTSVDILELLKPLHVSMADSYGEFHLESLCDLFDLPDLVRRDTGFFNPMSFAYDLLL